MPTCPNGHQSAADDWCEVCGHRMTGAPAAPAGAVPPPPQPPGGPGGYGYPGPPGAPGAPGPPPPAPGQGYGYPGPGPGVPQQGPGQTQAELCPQCGTPREMQAPFCEGCRYNFLTHSPTTYAPPAAQHPGAPGGFPGQGPGTQPQGPGPQIPGQGHHQPPGPPQGGQPMQPYPGGPANGQGQGPGQDPQGFEYERSQPSEMNRPAEPLFPYNGQQESAQPSDDWVLSPPGSVEQRQAAAGAPPPAPAPPLQPHAPEGPQPPRQPGPPSLPGMGGQGAPPQQGGPGQPPEFPQQEYGQRQEYGQQGDYGQQQPDYGRPGAPQPGGPWMAVIAPDRGYFTAMMGRSGPEAAALNLPAYSPEQQLPLSGPQITIGRRRASTGEAPDIDLGRPPEDPGVSHQHAVLVQQPDGTWSVVDQDSTNGTTINGAEDPIQPYVPVPLKEGDRVHVGAWTTITLHRT
ncbi:FHA domain-containing protein [Streptomyces sp. NBC_01775]|uniref:FHA domain-containing protein n=1 Tax=Streptomyces sp. NBC_01775 TaxID=2975939 RepID=UPI002DD7DF94|nr:FHA domain-containing protein [Streptomyces sp. NBC_01775]WSB79155.1 FHA domain-containing protein [Streptomyces sp. NBC_01775]